jgi:hypothetical protein
VRSTESQSTTATKLKRIAWLSSRDERKPFDSLMHHFNVGSLEECFHQLDGRKAVGIDGVTKAEYAERLDENLQDLVHRMKQMAYRPEPVRQVRTPRPASSHPCTGDQCPGGQDRTEDDASSLGEPVGAAVPGKRLRFPAPQRGSYGHSGLAPTSVSNPTSRRSMVSI